MASLRATLESLQRTVIEAYLFTVVTDNLPRRTVGFAHRDGASAVMVEDAVRLLTSAIQPLLGAGDEVDLVVLNDVGLLAAARRWGLPLAIQ
jgi:hypothetical protein